MGAGSLRVVRVLRPQVDRARFGGGRAGRSRPTSRSWRGPGARCGGPTRCVFTGSPPFLVHLLVPLNLLLRSRLTYRITDFHPECLIAELGRAPLRVCACSARWTIFLRRRVAAFEVLGEDQRRRLLEIGIPPGRISLQARPLAGGDRLRNARRSRAPAELGGRVVLLYSGNFGVAHDDETFLEGYRRHHAEGARPRRALAERHRRQGRPRRGDVAASRPARPPLRPVPLDRLAALLLAPDAHLITLRDEFVGYVLPSKVYGCVASGRPVLFVGSAEQRRRPALPGAPAARALCARRRGRRGRRRGGARAARRRRASRRRGLIASAMPAPTTLRDVDCVLDS